MREKERKKETRIPMQMQLNLILNPSIHRLNHNYKLITNYNSENENNIKSILTKNEFVKKIDILF